MHKDLIIVKQEIGSDYKDTTFNYKGYIIEEHYFAEEDCTHHSAVVFLGGQVLTEFRWEGCLKKAMEFVDAREDAKKYDSEGLKALKRIRQETCPATYNPDFNKLECCDTIEKELKALEIIKEKAVDVLMFKAHFIISKPEYEEYQYYLDNCEKYGFSAFYLTRQEFDLLKEVLL